MIHSNTFLLCVFCLITVGFVASLTDFYYESFEFINGANIPFYGNASLKRIGNDRRPKLFADIEITDDFKNYDSELKVYYSALGNQQFILMPYKFPRQSSCEQLKNTFWVQILRSLQNCSNLPISDDPNVETCDLFSLGHYRLSNCSVDQSIFSSKMLTGRFRFVIYIYKRTENEVLQTTVIQIMATFLTFVVLLCASIYSKTKTLIIRLKFLTDAASKFCRLSAAVCHWGGNGVVIR